MPDCWLRESRDAAAVGCVSTMQHVEEISWLPPLLAPAQLALNGA